MGPALPSLFVAMRGHVESRDERVVTRSLSRSPLTRTSTRRVMFKLPASFASVHSLRRPVLAQRLCCNLARRPSLPRRCIMAPKQATLGYVKPEQATLGCVARHRALFPCSDRCVATGQEVLRSQGRAPAADKAVLCHQDEAEGGRRRGCRGGPERQRGLRRG